MRPLVIGDLVKCTRAVLGNEEGTPGVVYEMYDIGDGPAVSVIFENGNYDGFSLKEQPLYLDRMGHCIELSDYKFENVMKVSKDFDDGVFEVAFN